MGARDASPPRDDASNMSQIIAEWINQEVKLSKQVTAGELDQLFRNGYLMGEVMNRLMLQDNFKTSFVDNSSAVDAAIKNFSLLEQSLREKLGIQLSSKTAMDLITAKSGCAAKLLHQIKTSLSKKQKAALEGRVNISSKPAHHLPPLERSDSAMSYPGNPENLPLLPSFQYTSPSKQKYDEQQRQFFADLLRSKIKRGDLATTPVKPPVSRRRARLENQANGIARAREPGVSTHIPFQRPKKIPLWDDPPPPRELTPPLDGLSFVLPHPEANNSRIREKIQKDAEKRFEEVCELGHYFSLIQ